MRTQPPLLVPTSVDCAAGPVPLSPSCATTAWLPLMQLVRNSHSDSGMTPLAGETIGPLFLQRLQSWCDVCAFSFFLVPVPGRWWFGHLPALATVMDPLSVAVVLLCKR